MYILKTVFRLFATSLALARWTTRCSLHVSALMIAAAFYSIALPATAQNQAGATSVEASEERVKAAFLYKFPNYVEWPSASFAKPDSPYVIGVIGDDLMLEELQRISAGKTINSRPLVVKKIQVNEPAAGAHVVFIGRSERARQAQLIKQYAAQPTLMVTETDNALTQGSMINFRLVDDRMRFDVSTEAAEKAGLKFSARLLAIALSVSRGTSK